MSISTIKVFCFKLLIVAGLFLLNACENKKVVEEYDFAFVDVNVISFEGDQDVLFNQTVLIKNGLIKIIASASSLEVSETIPQIDGKGSAYLMPGMVDAHTHIYDENEAVWLPLFIANGVTTVFNMAGTNETLKVRDMVATGKILGPALYTAGPLFQLPGVATPEDAERVFLEQVEAGFDFIKIYGDLRPEAYKLAADLGNKTPGIAVVGHAPRNLPFDSVLENGQTMLAHMEEIIYTKFNDRNFEIFPDYAKKIAENSDLYITATLNTFSRIVDQWGRTEAVDISLQSDLSKYLTPDLLQYWTENNGYITRDPNFAPVDNLEFQKLAVYELYKAGVPLLTGTDTPLPTVYPGFSLLEELELFHEAGIPIKEALKAATLNPGRFFRQHVNPEVLFGQVLPNYRADLILLDNNPLEDLENVKNPAGVMVNGRWLSRKNIETMLRDLVLAIETMPEPSDEQIEAYPMDLETLESFTGRYVMSEPYVVIEWFVKDGELYNGEVDVEQKFRMIPVGENTFQFADFPVVSLAEFSQDKSKITMTSEGNVNGIFFKEEEQ